jgi:hypothetical protein
MPRLLILVAAVSLLLVPAVWLEVATSAAQMHGGGGGGGHWSGGGGGARGWSGGGGQVRASGGGEFRSGGGGSWGGSRSVPSTPSPQWSPRPQSGVGGSSAWSGRGGRGTFSTPFIAPRARDWGGGGRDFDRDDRRFGFDRDDHRHRFGDFDDRFFFGFGWGGPSYWNYSTPYVCYNPIQCENCRRAYNNGDTWYLSQYCSAPYY